MEQPLTRIPDSKNILHILVRLMPAVCHRVNNKRRSDEAEHGSQVDDGHSLAAQARRKHLVQTFVKIYKVFLLQI